MKTYFTNSCSRYLILWGSLLILFLFPAKLKAQTLIIGSDEATSYDLPLATCMAFNYSQQIYTYDELVDAGATGPILITKISFMASPWNSSSSSNYKNWVVYMGNTGLSGFESATSWVPFAALTEVFDDELPGTISAGEWVELTLATPFFWDGESNLVIAVDENSPGWFCSQDWVAYWTPEMRGMVYSSDDMNPDPESPPASTYMGDMVPYIKIDYEETGTCDDVEFAVGTLSASDVCPDVSFVVVNSGTMLTSGVTREWQMRVPSGTGEWTTIEGVSSINYTNVEGISEATDYRCIVTCDATGESDITNEVTVDLNPVSECYCEPVFSGDCSWGWETAINDVFTAGAVTDFSNTGTGCTGGYQDYSEDYEASAVQFSMFTVSVGTINTNGGVKIWIDWNQNGSFDDDGELVGTSDSELPPGSTFTVNVEVPGYAVPGTTKMRVGTMSWSTWFDPCMSDPWDGGEVEDYAITVIEADPCDELELTAGSLSPFDICPSTEFMVFNSGTTLGAGMERTWQMRVPSGTGDWVTIDGATGVHYINEAGIMEPTDYRCIVSCPASEEIDTTNVITVGVSPFTDCYCTPSYIDGCTWSARINDVSTSGAIIDFSNLETGCTSGSGTGYTDYSEDYSATVMQLQTVTVEVGISNNSGGVKVWIDYNHNGIFEEEEIVGESPVPIDPGSTFVTTFTIPPDAATGWTKMRVRTVSWDTYFDACEEFWEGEAEDYGIMINPAPNCTEVTWPETIMAISSPAAVCGTGDIFLTLDGEDIPLAFGISYEWESSSTGTGSWASVSPDLSAPGYVMSGVGSNTYFRCVIKCDGVAVMYSESILVETINPENPEVISGQHCGPGSVALSANIGSGFVYWYETPDGDVPFDEGETIMTPEISTTTTYYVRGGAYPANLVQIGESSSTSSMWNVGPFNINNRRSTMQMLYTADQIAESGGTTGVIDGLRFNLAGLPSEGIPDYTISVKFVPSTMNYLTGWQTDGFTEVYYNTLFEPTETGWQVFPFSTPLFYDGTSGIVVQVCWSNVEEFWSGTGTHKYTNTPGQMLYYNTSDEGNSCGDIGEWTSNELPNVIFSFIGCVSEAVPVEAFIRDTPVIQIDLEDGEYCLFNNTITLNTTPEQPVGTALLWNTGATTSSITATSTGATESFWVRATNEWGCETTDTAILTLNPSPEVDLGPDIFVCEGSEVVLDAGTDGNKYYWSNSETTQIITVDVEGTYTVLVTNDYGCMGSDTINVIQEGFAPSIDGIIVENIGPTKFSFTPLHPENVISYNWDFGDGYTSTDAAPEHTYEYPGSYEITLEVTSSCGTVTYYTFVTIALGIDDTENAKSLDIYPNPTQRYLNIDAKEGIRMNELKVINSLGQVLLTQELDMVNSFQLDVSQLPSGSYYIHIQSDQGALIKKFQIVR